MSLCKTQLCGIIVKYCEIPIINLGLYLFKRLFAGLIFGGEYCWKQFCISKWVGLDNNNSDKHYENSLKQLKTANTNSPWAYNREGLLSEGFLRLTFGELIFGRAYFCGALFSRNFTVFLQYLLVCLWSVFEWDQ